MEIYYTPVFLTLLAMLAQIQKNRRLDISVLLVCSLVIILISGLRWYSDVDYEPYVWMYDDNPLLSEFSRDSIRDLYGEPGYLLLSSIFKSLGASFFILAFACAAFSILLKSIVVLKLSEQASLAICLYFCIHFITIEFIQIRWAIATSLIILGFYCQYLQKNKTAFLCFALSLGVHYFSAFFLVVALLLNVNGYRRFYFLFFASLFFALFFQVDYLQNLIINDSDIYVIKRITRYAIDPESQVGFFSYVKLIMYPAIYSACVFFKPSYPWKTDKLNLFLFKISFISLAATFFVTFIPLLHFRATVIADFFSIILILNSIDKAFPNKFRILIFVIISFMYLIWYLIDVFNYINADRLYEYKTWLTASI